MRGSSCARPQAACRPFGRRALLVPWQAQAATTAAQRRPLAPALHQKRTPAVEPPPRRRRLRCPCAAAAARGLWPPFRLFPRTIRPLTAYWAVNIADGSRKFARKLACPPDFVRGTWMRFGKLSSLLILGSGGRRLRTRAVFPSNGLGYGGLCPHPPRHLRFLGTSICCRPFGRRALLIPWQAQAATTAAQRRRLVPTLHQKRTPSGQAPTTGAQPASPVRGSSCARPQAALDELGVSG